MNYFLNNQWKIFHLIKYQWSSLIFHEFCFVSMKSDQIIMNLFFLVQFSSFIDHFISFELLNEITWYFPDFIWEKSKMMILSFLIKFSSFSSSPQFHHRSFFFFDETFCLQMKINLILQSMTINCPLSSIGTI